MSRLFRILRSLCYVAVFESYHTVRHVVAVICRLLDALLPLRVACALRRLLGRRRFDVSLSSGICIGEALFPTPGGLVARTAQEKRAVVVLFEGVTYAESVRFGPPQLLPKTSALRWLNAPRFCDAGFRFGTAAAHAPQEGGVFALDAPLLLVGVQSLVTRLVRGYIGSEKDCLQLNLWVPQHALCRAAGAGVGDHHGPLPVLVFLHGGAFLFGACHQTIANGQALAESGDCIVVSCNYRVGLLGYMFVGGDDDSLNGSGNVCQNRGLRDQVAALQWVKANIAFFGGDPSNITLCGQSAGSTSVGALLGVAESYDLKLFQRATMMSGTAQNLPTKEEAQEVWRVALQLSGLQTETELLRRLKSAPTRDVIALQRRIVAHFARTFCHHTSSMRLPFQPFVEGCGRRGGAILPRHPMLVVRSRIRQGLAVPPLLIGTTDTEYTFFTRSAIRSMFPVGDGSVKLRLRQFVHKAFHIPLLPPADDSADTETSASHSSGEILFSNFAYSVEVAFESGDLRRRYGPPFDVYNAVCGDFLFRLSSEMLANEYASATAVRRCNTTTKKNKDQKAPPQEVVYRCWMYRFDQPAAVPRLGATHALDLHYFFESWWCPPYYTGGPAPGVRALSTRMRRDLLSWICRDHEEMMPHVAMPWPEWNLRDRPLQLYSAAATNGCCVAEHCDSVECSAWGDIPEHLLRTKYADDG